jgi:hypothetical protein
VGGGAWGGDGKGERARRRVYGFLGGTRTFIAERAERLNIGVAEMFLLFGDVTFAIPCHRR